MDVLSNSAFCILGWYGEFLLKIKINLQFCKTGTRFKLKIVLKSPYWPWSPLQIATRFVTENYLKSSSFGKPVKLSSLMHYTLVWKVKGLNLANLDFLKFVFIFEKCVVGIANWKIMCGWYCHWLNNKGMILWKVRFDMFWFSNLMNW